MVSSALLLAIATHPFQIAMALAAVLYAARELLPPLPKRRPGRLVETLRLRHAA